MASDFDDEYIDDPEELDPNVFHIWDPLQRPVTLQYTTEQLHKMIHQGDIDLDPEYQRAVVWSSSKQMAIIDSLFHNYYVPPVVFAIANDPEAGDEMRLCVDGKQRLTSIQKFFDGQIAFEYHNLSAAAEREVFQRVQLGVSLTAAEKLQAIASPWARYITHLEKTHLTIDGGLVDHIAFDDTRGRAFQNTAQLVYCCAGLPAAQRVPTAPKLEKWLTTPDEHPSTAFKDAMAAVLTRLWELACDEELDAPFRRFKAKVSPVEFVYIGVLLYSMRHGYTAAEQSRAAFVLRRDIRKAHVDVRFNSRVATDCWRLIDAIENGEVNFEASVSAPKSMTNGKRKSLDSQSSPVRPVSQKGGKKRKAG